MLFFVFLVLVLGLIAIPLLPARALEKRWEAQDAVSGEHTQIAKRKRYLLRFFAKTTVCGCTAIIYVIFAVAVLKITQFYLPAK